MNELLNLHDEIQLAAQQWQTAFNAIRDAVCFLDLDGTILRCNIAVTKIVRKPFHEIIGHPCRDIIPYCIHAKAVPMKSPKCPLIHVKQSRSRKILNSKIGNRWFHIVCDPVFNEHGDIMGMVHSMYDITIRKRAQEKIRQSEEKLRTMIESIADGITVVDLKGNIVELNEAAVYLHGYHHKDDLIGTNSIELLSLKGRDEALNKMRRVLQEGRSGLVEYKALTKHQNEFDAELSAALLTDKFGQPSGFIAVTKDISERKKVETELENSREELRNLYAYLVSVREQERTSIAREIHDELGQSLTALKLDVSSLKKRLPENEASLHKKSQQMLYLIDNTIKAVKKLCAELRPAVLDNLGISAAIEWEASEFVRRTGIESELALGNQNISLDRDHATAIFRIFQEALTNIARHANATKFWVCLRKNHKSLTMKIVDNGKGIKQGQILSSKSFGLIGMRERIHYYGGEVKIRGIANEGTTIEVRTPLQGGKEQVK
ncbi:PAS domain S-box protein [Chloroflexota bacterium]